MDWRYVVIPLVAISLFGALACALLQNWVGVAVCLVLIVGLVALGLMTSGVLDD